MPSAGSTDHTGHYDLAAQATAWGLTLAPTAAGDDACVTLRREGLTVRLPADALPDPAATLAERHVVFATLYGIRLGIDRRTSGYDLRAERPTGRERARDPYEVRSLYGDRLQRLVPRRTVAWAAAIGDFTPFVGDWAHPELAVLYVLETGRALHTLGEEDFEAVDFDRANADEYARYALFYESYRARPTSEERGDHGRVKTFASREGLTSSRALLMPDFDYDAARESGAFVVADRDTLLVGQPAGPAHREANRAALVAAARQTLAASPMPFASCLFDLSITAVTPGAELAPSSPLPVPFQGTPVFELTST